MNIKKMLKVFLVLSILNSCEFEKDMDSGSYSEKIITHTTDFKYLSVVKLVLTSREENECRIEVDLYQTTDEFRLHMANLQKQEELFPEAYFDFKVIGLDSPLENMKLLRSIQILDRIRPVPCVDPDEYYTEYRFLHWQEGMEPVLGHSAHVVNRSDTTFVVNIRHERTYIHLW